jgi:hypothetical protein
MGASGFPAWRGQLVEGRLAKKWHYSPVGSGPEGGDVLTTLYATFQWNTAAVEENDTAGNAARDPARPVRNLSPCASVTRQIKVRWRSMTSR